MKIALAFAMAVVMPAAALGGQEAGAFALFDGRTFSGWEGNPAHFRIDLWPEPNREDNVHGSKAVGEPPFMLAISVFEALRDAVAQAGGRPEALNAPATAEEVLNSLAS